MLFHSTSPIQSFTTIEELKAANKSLSTEVRHISEELKELRLNVQAQIHSSGTTIKNQTNSQSDTTTH